MQKLSVYSKMFHWIQTTKLDLDWLSFLMPLKLQVQMVAECKGKEWFTWVQACQCCALAEKTTRLSSVWWPIRDVLLLCWKTFFSCWHTKALASCLASRSTSRYSALILPLIFPSSVIKVELWEKCNREIKGNKHRCIQCLTQTGHQTGQCNFIGNRWQNMGGETFLMSYNLFMEDLRSQAKLRDSQALKMSLFTKWWNCIFLFSVDGQLRHTNTGEPFVFNYKEDLHRWNQKRYEALGEVMFIFVNILYKNVIFYFYRSLCEFFVL